MSPARGTRSLARRLELKFVVTLYLVAAALLPLAHHDISCHLKSTTHCTVCNIGSSAESGADGAVISNVVLPDAGDTAPEPPLRVRESSRLFESGRAPPPLA